LRIEKEKRRRKNGAKRTAQKKCGDFSEISRKKPPISTTERGDTKGTLPGVAGPQHQTFHPSSSEKRTPRKTPFSLRQKKRQEKQLLARVSKK